MFGWCDRDSSIGGVVVEVVVTEDLLGPLWRWSERCGGCRR